MGSGSSAQQTKMKDATTAEGCTIASEPSKEDKEKIVAAPAKLDEDTHDLETDDAGAGRTQAGKVEKDSHLMIKGRPCKCVEVSTSGEGEALIVAIDILTGKKMEHVCPASDKLEVLRADAKFTEYEVLRADADTGELSLMKEMFSSKDDVKLPTDKKMKAEICDEFVKGEKSIYVTVQAACGEEKIVGVRCVR
ncbi:EIF-5A1 [Symbiodinium sp. CCMP2592]|nr:EIF-5A1 [Symbiodinium sp. CCMP2592]